MRRIFAALVACCLLLGAGPSPIGAASSSASSGVRPVRAFAGALVPVRAKLVPSAGLGLAAPSSASVASIATPLVAMPLVATSDIQVTYSGFSQAARDAFEAAVTVWEGLIVSPRVIHVSASWTPLASGVLGSAGPSGLYLMSDDRVYPAALTEALCNCEVRASEINAQFNSAFSGWYLGTDGNVPANKYDFFTVVLHELGHGLGFLSSFGVSGTLGGWGYTSGSATYPMRFDLEEWNAATSGKRLSSTAAFANPSTSLKNQLTDGTVYFGGANVVAAYGGRAALFAPSSWQSGSSNSHFDEATFPTGSVNALMTPSLANGEAIHHPGPLTLALFRDIGWSTASAATAPGAPTSVTALAGHGQATVSWQAPSSNGGSPITSYTATSSPDGLSCSSATLSCTVSGLGNGTTYTFAVTATNSIGAGPPSGPSNSVIPTDLPGPPTAVSAVPGNGQASVSWVAPASSGSSAITGYAVASEPSSDGCTATTVLGCTVSGLVNGTPYTFRVTATNDAGTGLPSEPSASVTPATVPNAPTGATAVAGNATATVSWVAPTGNGGSPVTGYAVASSPGAKTCATGGPLSCVVSGLANGTAYTFSVTALNAAGSSPPSGPSNSVTPSGPDVTAPIVAPPARALLAPQTLGTTVLLRVSWPPASDPSGIARYELQRRKGSGSWTSITLPSLTATSVDVAVAPGASYRFRLRARDGAGNIGAWVTTAAATTALLQETSTKIAYVGTWARVALSGASGGYVRNASASGRICRLTFSGSSVAFVSTLAAGRGKATVWLDGALVQTLDLYSASTIKRRVVWATAVGGGTHVLEVRVTGTRRAAATSTRVDVDAFLVQP